MGCSRRKAIVISFLLVLSALSAAALAEKLDEAANVVEHIKSGDLVFRRGRGLASEVARNLSSRDRRFSHVGIAVQQDDGFAVIHAIHDIANNRDGVVMDSLESFLDRVDDWAVYRMSMLPSERDTVARMAIDANEASIPFDRRFDLGSVDEVYCTELVWRIINGATGEVLITPTVSVGNRRIVAISDVYAHKSIRYVIGAESILLVGDKQQSLSEQTLMTTIDTVGWLSRRAGPNQIN